MSLRLLVALVVLGPIAPTPPAAAQPAVTAVGPRCPAVVAGQPLSVSVPFSGTVRPRADDGDRVESNSLHCAYGEGAAPAAELTVTWAAGSAPCATTEVAVASGLDAAPFEQAAGDLADAAGTGCAPAAAGGWPVGAIAGGVVVGVGLVVLGRRRRASRAAASALAPVAADLGPPVVDEPPAAPLGAPKPVADPAGGSAPTVADVGPVLALLAGPGGRTFARTGAGQLAVLAAVAYGSGDSITGDLARAGSLAGLPVRLRPRPEVADLAWGEAHHGGAPDR